MVEDGLRERIEELLGAGKVVVFMKGTPDQPRCGFSARVIAQLQERGIPFQAHDILSDGALREGMKAYADWPTFPQVWVDASFIGGADILEELHRRGELDEVFGQRAPKPTPSLHLTRAAAARIGEAVGEARPRLRLRIDAAFQHVFEAVEDPDPGDVVATSEGITFILDPASAERADGLRLDWVTSGTQQALVVDNPNEPAKVQSLSPHVYAAWRREGRPHLLVDVRPPEERALAQLDGALGIEGLDFESLDPRQPIVFLCHHGIRSLHAAAHAVDRGLRAVFNLEGGLDAWSLTVDPTTPRYG
jgi:monothiol glutaredoxin